MTFTVEVLLKGREDVVAQSVQHGVAPEAWTDDDVRAVLHLALREFERAQDPAAEARPVQLRGLSWIVTPLARGVAIAMESASGAVVAGPFEIDRDRLTQAIERVMTGAAGPPAPGRVH